VWKDGGMVRPIWLEKRFLPTLVTVCLLLSSAVCVRAETPTLLPYSPFTFPSPPAGKNSNVAVLNGSETLLFVANQESNTITVLNVASDGSLSAQGTYATTPSIHAVGMALNPGGTRLYVTTYGDTVNVHAVAADGTLTQVQAASLGTPSSAEAGIVYVSLAGGDFVYVNNNEVPNTVTRFPVNADGSLGTGTVVATGGNGAPIGLFAAPRLLAGADGRLYAMNEGASTIAVFDVVAATGALVPVAGSPFALPTNVPSSGALAISADGTALYAGTRLGSVVQYQIDGPTGALNLVNVGSSGISDDIAGLVVDPTGAFVVGVLFLSKKIAVFDTTSMTPITASPFAEDVTAPTSYAAGTVMNHAGTLLYSGNANLSGTEVSVYAVGP
jgi:lactonase family protein with 7-bladed beta-propeller